MDFNLFKIRCSSLSVLFTEPQSKSAKEAGELSETAKKHLYEVYIEAKWGRSEDISTKEMEKGKLVQDQIMDILSFMEDVIYKRNTERKSNEWITGEADIISDIVTDIKASWKPSTFIPYLMGPIPAMYAYQNQGYMWLWDKPAARTVWGLVDCPEQILKKERQKLLYSLDVASDEADEYKEAVKELEFQLTFGDIPLSQRLIIKKSIRDEEIISQIPEKVRRARKFLQLLDENHEKMANFVAGIADIEERA